MKKIVLSSLITIVLLFSGTANAALTITVVGFTAFMTTLASPIPGFLLGAAGLVGGIGVGVELTARDAWSLIAEKTGSEGLAAAAVVGLVLLDENRQVIEFKSIDPAHASDHGVTEAEIDIYNSELPIINIVADEFSKLYGDEVMTQQEATAAFKEVAVAAGLSEECQVVLSRVVIHQLKSS